VRPTITRQSDMFAAPVEHELATELREIDQVIRAHPEWVRWVHADLTKARGVSASSGRAGMSANQVLRVVVLKHRLGVSLRRLAPLLADSASLREFVGIGMVDRAPRRQTLQDNITKVRSETWGKLLGAFAVSAEAQEFESGERVRVDATVTETNVHEPSDSSLLWDSIRVLTRLMKRSRDTLGVAFDDESRAAKKLQKRIFYARGKAERAPVYADLLGVSARVDARAADVLDALRRLKPRSPKEGVERDALAAGIQHYRVLFGRVISQTERRVLKGETVPAQEKVLSIFEPETDLIKKSGSQPAEFGHKITLTSGKSGFVLDCVIERGNPVDVTLAIRQLERQKKLFGSAPRAAAFDGGYASKENLDAAKALGTERCAFSKGRGLTPEEMAGSRRTYGRLRNFRAAIEATVSLLKRAYGLTRCIWKGWARFQSYVWSAILAANLTLLARKRLCTT